jgi:hypothetical protein
MTENRIYVLQEEYFEFCLALFRKIPAHNVDTEVLIKLYQLKDQLTEEIRQFKKNCTCDTIREVQLEIEKLRNQLNNHPA